MMKTLTKIGIVLVVLAMVTSSAFASDNKSGDSGSWCDADIWSREVPYYDDGDKVRISDGEHILVDCDDSAPEGEVAGADDVQLRGDSSLTIGVVGSFFPEVIPEVVVDLIFRKELELADDSTSDYCVLNIANGSLIVEDESKDIFEDGSGEINIAAGSSLTFEERVYFGDSNGDGCNDTYTLDIAGSFALTGGGGSDRLEHRGGHLTIDLTQNGSFSVKKTSRLSSKRDAIATINISDNAKASFDKVELGEGNDGADCDYSLAINISGNGKWDGGGEDIKDQDDGQIFKLDVTGNGSFTCDELDINDTDSEIHITMDSGTINIENDIDMEAGTIVITGGTFNVDDDLKLGDKDVATMTVSGTADVWIDDLYMGEDSALTINDVRVDLDDLEEMKGGSSINLSGCNAELVIKNADDEDDWDEIAAWIAGGQITTSEAGKAVVWDYGVSNEDRLTVKVVTPATVDIKPGTCPNPLRLNFVGQGSIKVVIVGSDDLDVLDVDVATLTLEGVSPSKSSYKDISTIGAEACECAALGPDGKLDLELKFNRADLLDALEARAGDLSLLAHRSLLSLTLDGALYEALGCLPIQGSDCIEIRNRGAIKTRK